MLESTRMIAIAVSGTLLAAAAGLVVARGERLARASAEVSSALFLQPLDPHRRHGRGKHSARPVAAALRHHALPVRRRHVREPGSLRLGRTAPALLRQVAEPGIQDPSIGIRGPTSNGDPHGQAVGAQGEQVRPAHEGAVSRSLLREVSTTRHSTRSRPELEKVFEVAWDGYINYRKAPRTRPAGKGYADPKYQLSVEWSETRAKLAGRREAPEGARAPARAS